MRTLTVIFALAVACFPQLRADDSNNVFVVTAFIDGTSRLVVTSNSVYWDHRQFYQPGKNGSTNYPTYLDGFPWWPTWSPELGPYDAGVSLPLPVRTAFLSNTVTSRVILGNAAAVTVLEQPTANQPLVVEFDDGPIAGANWFRVELTGVSVDYNAPLSVEVAAVALRFFAKSNRVFQVQYTTSLFEPAWVNVGAPVVGNGETMTVTDSVLDMPRRFYRVLTLP